MDGEWTFLSTHGLVLLAIASNPQATQREIAARVGVTEKTVQKVVRDLVNEGYIERFREGRRNRYEIKPDAPLRHRMIGRDAHIRGLVGLLAADG